MLPLLALAVVVLGIADATQTPFFNVTLSKNPDGPPQYFVAALPGVAVVASMVTEAYSTPGYGLLTAVNNVSGKVLWSRNMSTSGFGEGLGTLRENFVVLDSEGALTVLSSAGATVWSAAAPPVVIGQAFAVHVGSDLVARVVSNGAVTLYQGSSGVVLWSVTLAVPMWTTEGSLSVTLSDEFVVAVFSGTLFTLSVTSTVNAALYERNVASLLTFVSPRFAIVGNTLAFCSQTTVSTMQLSTGIISNIDALNTSQYTYNEVVIAPDGLQLYVLTLEGNFDVGVHPTRLRGGNNIPMFVTANDVRDGTQLWEWFTDDTVSFLNLVGQDLMCFVTTGGPLALWTRSGTLASSATGGLDYSEPAPPLLYHGRVWYYASEFYRSFPETVNFIGVVSDL